MEFFSMDNLFFRTVNKFVDLIWINLLTLLCSLPIITAGAAITAMYSNLLYMAENNEGALTRSFFRSFRENLKKATKVWLGILMIILVAGYNLYLLNSGALSSLGKLGNASLIALLLVLCITLMVGTYIFSLLARYENTLKQTIKNACLLSVAFFPRSLCMVVILFFPLALMMLSNYFLWLWFLYGLSFPGYFISMLLVRIFDKITLAEDEEKA